MKYIIICNGKPQSGKTTFQKLCKDYLNTSELAYCHIHSSIDYIKDIYKKLGWDGKKTDKARKDLSTLKQMWVDNCNGPLKCILKLVMELDSHNDHIIFTDIREESEIIKFKETFDALEALDIKCITLFVNRSDNDGLEYGNKSDDNVGRNMSLYRCEMLNDGTIDDLRRTASEFIETLLNGGITNG